MITLEGPQGIVDKSSKKILARGKVPPPLSGNAKILGAYGPPTHPLVNERVMTSLWQVFACPLETLWSPPVRTRPSRAWLALWHTGHTGARSYTAQLVLNLQCFTKVYNLRFKHNTQSQNHRNVLEAKSMRLMHITGYCIASHSWTMDIYYIALLWYGTYV